MKSGVEISGGGTESKYVLPEERQRGRTVGGRIILQKCKTPPKRVLRRRGLSRYRMMKLCKSKDEFRESLSSQTGWTGFPTNEQSRRMEESKK